MKIPGVRQGAAAAVAGSNETVTQAMLEMRPQAIWQALRAEHVSVIALCIYLLFEYIKPEQNYPIFGILPFLRIAWMISLVAAFSDKLAGVRNSPLNWLVPLFLVHCFASAVLAFDSAYSFQRLDVTYMWVLIFFLITGVITTERRLFLFVIAYFIANLKMSQFGFFSWAKRGFGFANYGLTGAGWFRNSGELGLEMTMFFAYTLCLAMLLRQYWSGWRKWLMYFLPFSAAAVVVGSSSRGAIVGAIAVLFYLSLFSRKKIRAWLSSSLLIVVAYYIMPPQFIARFHTAGQDPTSLSRIFYWAKAKEMMRAHPWFGAGYYNWIPYYKAHYFDPTLYWRVEEAHNTFWQLGAEIGYLGLGLFILLIVVSFFMNWKSERLCRRPGFEFLRAWALGMNAAGVGMVVASIFLTAWFMPNYWFHFAFTVVLRRAINHKIAAAAAATDITAVPVPEAGHPAVYPAPAGYSSYPGYPRHQGNR